MVAEMNLTPEQIAAKSYNQVKIAGRGLFYGAAGSGGHNRVFSEAAWDAACAQAVSWGIAAVHPKVADGGYWWYDAAGLQMLKVVADKHKLICYPYQYCYGDKFGALGIEASYTIAIGKRFGGVVPDMEIEWERDRNGSAWAKRYGEIVRGQFNGPVLPTLFANPTQHSGFPYEALLEWVSGWMPMAYYDLWTQQGKQMTAKEAVYFLYPQWVALNKSLVAHGIFPPPILPLIELGDHLPVAEVVSWMTQMKNYGYGGFWYDGTYAPYASAIKAAANPAWKLAAPPAPPTQPVPVPPVKPVPTGTIGSSAPDVDPPTTVNNITITAGMKQHINAAELAASWAIVAQHVPYDPNKPIPKLWAMLLLSGYAIGAVTGVEIQWTFQGVTYTYQEFEGGRIWSNSLTGDVWVQPTSIARVPGSAAAETVTVAVTS